jgi:hypothetical protein
VSLPEHIQHLDMRPRGGMRSLQTSFGLVVVVVLLLLVAVVI